MKEVRVNYVKSFPQVNADRKIVHVSYTAPRNYLTLRSDTENTSKTYKFASHVNSVKKELLSQNAATFDFVEKVNIQFSILNDCLNENEECATTSLD